MQALILAGGTGTRFWPLSRRRRPKQLLALEGEASLLAATVERLAPLIHPEDVWVCTTEILADAVRAELPRVPPEQILVEPCGRNTAPAIGWSLAVMPEAVRHGVVAVLPADHRLTAGDELRTALAQAADAVGAGDGEAGRRVLTLGVRPRWPETGYGYLELGAPLAGTAARTVERFTEKPDVDTARRWVEGDRHLWNAGIFVFRGTALLDHLTRCAPELGRRLELLAAQPGRTAEVYPELPSISIDYAVMERLSGSGEIAAVPLDGGWSDLGSWQALAEVLPADGDGNRRRGDVLAVDARDNLLYADTGTVAVLGVEGLVVVRTGDSVLVMPRERSQEVRRLVDALAEAERGELL